MRSATRETELEELKNLALPDRFVLERGALIFPRKAEIVLRDEEPLPDVSRLIFPDEVRSIRREGRRNGPYLSFASNRSVTEIALPSGLRAIESHLFANYDELTRVLLPSELEFIEAQAFGYCRLLEEIELPPSLRSIGCGAFDHCASLRKMRVPAGVKEIASMAFAYCSGLEELILENPDARFGKDMVTGCPRVRVSAARDANVSNQDRFNRTFGLEDEGGFVIKKTILTGYNGSSRSVAVPEGVKIVELSAFEDVVRNADEFILSLPASVRELRYFHGEDWEALLKKVRFEFSADYPTVPRLMNHRLARAMVESPDADARLTATALLCLDGKPGGLPWGKLESPEGVDALLEVLSSIRMKNARTHAARFFFDHEPLFSLEQKKTMGRLLRAGRTKKDDYTGSELDETPWPEPAIDELMDVHGADPEAPALQDVRLVSGGKADPALVKSAFLPYLIEGSELDEYCFASPQTGYNPVQFSKAEAYAARLDPSDLARAADELWKNNTRKNVASGLLLVFARYGTYETYVAENPRYGWAPADRSRVSYLAREALYTNESPIVLRESSKSSDPGEMIKYVWARSGLDGLDARLPSFFEADDQGRVKLASGEKELLACVGPSLTVSVLDPASGKTWKRLPATTDLPPEELEKVKETLSLLSAYLKELKIRLDETVFDWYVKGTTIPAADFTRRFENPLVANALSGIVWARGKTDFAYLDGEFRDRSGARAEPPADGEVRVAHVAELGKDKMNEWESLLASEKVEPWMTQVFEPRYTPASVAANRYLGMTIPVRSLDRPLRTGFVADAMERAKKSRRLQYYVTFENSKRIVLMGEAAFKRIDRGANTLLYFLDQLTAEEQVRDGNLDILPSLASMPNAKLKKLLEISRKAGRTAVTAALLQMQDERKGSAKRSVETFSI